IYAQLIDDESGHTLITESTLNNEIDKDEFKDKTAQAGRVGELIAEKAKNKGIAKVVFDRGGYRYHGRVKSLSDAARKTGLNF
ncbi:MAG: 50S ribosomal protein L18, partial [Desulfobulbaceae bacterium]|nr:50S ribosomal protein L18 [Desulfobulbaceae bacterium]